MKDSIRELHRAAAGLTPSHFGLGELAAAAQRMREQLALPGDVWREAAKAAAAASVTYTAFRLSNSVVSELALAAQHMRKQLALRDDVAHEAAKAAAVHVDAELRLKQAAEPTVVAARALQLNLAPLLRQHEEATQTWHAALARIEEPIRRQLASVAHSDTDVARALAESMRYAPPEWVRDLSQRLGHRHFGLTDEVLERLSQIIADEVVTAVDRESAEIESAIGFPLSTNTVLETADRAAARSADLGLSRDSVIQLVFAVLLFLLAAYDSGTHYAALENRLQEISTQLDDVQPPLSNIDQPRYYTTIVAIRLRARPDTRGETIMIIPPAQLIEVLEHDGRWLRVEVFDFAADIYHSGWVYRRNLTAVLD